MKQLSQRGAELLEQMHGRRAAEQDRKLSLAIVEEASRRTFRRLCFAHDVDPAGLVSPTLRKILNAKTLPPRDNVVEPL